ncbi:CDC48 family AAA ATPase [Lachnotalea glycerini]|nr:CDC48 family AAA ATPase [Lachnotalea glycerini]
MMDVCIGRKNGLSLKVQEAESKDVGRGIARMDQDDMARLGAEVGDIIYVSGKKDTVAKLLPLYQDYRHNFIIQIDNIIRENAGIDLEDYIIVKKCVCFPADTVVLAPILKDGEEVDDWDVEYIKKCVEGIPVIIGDKVRIKFFGAKVLDFKVVKTYPKETVLLNSDTVIKFTDQTNEAKIGGRAAYEDIGGLHAEIKRVREMIELPFRFPEIFEKIGVDPPNGVLLCGPPGTGKTLIARAVATETDAYFTVVNGPEIIHKFYGESEANLRDVFEEAARQAPAIIFIDEIDAIAPKRTEVTGEVEKRVVGQLLALMDGLKKRKQVVVIGATNIPDVLDPALRRPGRFDREITISVPNQEERVEILKIHTRGMPLADDVDLVKISEITHGFVGADLEAICREAGMYAVRKILPEIDFYHHVIPYETLMTLEINMEHFTHAIGAVEPSAIREVFVEIPNVMWDDIGGLSEIKSALKKAIEWPLKYKKLFNHLNAHSPKGILLTGPPGVGKTLIAKAAASMSNANFISIKGPALFSKWVGESEKKVREIFKKAKQAAPCIIFFDEIDALTSQRALDDADSGVGKRVISQLLTELDGIEELKGVVVLAATNRIELVDQALLRQGRFDQIFEIAAPNEQERFDIFNIHLRNRPVSERINIEELVSRTSGFVGADIYSVCEKAAMNAIDSYLESMNDNMENLSIHERDLYQAIDEVVKIKNAAKSLALV